MQLNALHLQKNKMLTAEKNLKPNILSDFLSENGTDCLLKQENKKRVLQYVSKLFSENLTDISSRDILEHLTARERLGSTGIDQGVALPHARIAGIALPIITLLTLKTPIEYESLDKQKVDIICALLVPENTIDEHLKILANLASLFREEKFCDALRAAKDSKSLYLIATQWSTNM